MIAAFQHNYRRDIYATYLHYNEATADTFYRLYNP